MTQAVSTQPAPWHSRLTPEHWRILTASFLGWIFDGYETYALISVLGPALLALLPAEEHARLPEFAGLAISLTLLGGIGARRIRPERVPCRRSRSAGVASARRVTADQRHLRRSGAS